MSVTSLWCILLHEIRYGGLLILCGYLSQSTHNGCIWTHWALASLQMTFSKAFGKFWFFIVKFHWSLLLSIQLTLTHCGLVTPYGNRDLGQHWHQAITWTNVDLSSIRSCGIHQKALSWEDLNISISKTRLKIKFLESHSDLPGANELSHWISTGLGSLVPNWQ